MPTIYNRGMSDEEIEQLVYDTWKADQERLLRELIRE